MKFISVVSILAVALFSCAPSREIVVIMQNTHDKPPGYQDGFMNGCGSGFQQGGDEGYLYFKDLRRYESDEQYRKGWQDGLEKCSG